MLSLFQLEPFFLTLALFDAQQGVKLSEDFHVDVNPSTLREMLPLPPNTLDTGPHPLAKYLNSIKEVSMDPGSFAFLVHLMAAFLESRGQLCYISDWRHFNSKILFHPIFPLSMQAVFSVTQPHEEVYLVARIEKVSHH